VALAFINAIILFAIGEIVGAVFMLLFGFLNLLWAYLVRNRIPFSATILQICTETIRRFPAVVYVAYGSILVQGIWLMIWLVAASSILNDQNNQNTNGSGQGAAVFFLLLSFYWTTQVIKNIVHVTVSGLIATVYFMGNAMPVNPTMASLSRALTTSLGSICLGSLIVALIKTIRALVRMMRSERNFLLLCLVDCILSCIDSLVRYFNHYAFCQVAIYGKTFCEAASATWKLLETSGLEAIANDNLIGGVLNMGILCGALITGGAGAVCGLFTQMFNGNDIIVLFFVGLVIGALFMTMSLQVIDSGVACTFVCFAEDKETLRRNNPELWQVLMETYNLAWS